MTKHQQTYLDTLPIFAEQLTSSSDLRQTLTDTLKTLLKRTSYVLITLSKPNPNPKTFLNTLKKYPKVYQGSMSRQFAADLSPDIEQTSLKDESKDWFIKTADFGDDCDRVLQHRSGESTQLLEDLACYHQKFQDGCERVILLRPPAYKGYDIQLTAAMKALGYTSEQFQFIVIEPIKLYAFHVPTQRLTPIPDLSSEELIQAIGMDALRWHGLRVPLTSVAPINISTAGQPTPADSLYQVQAAHARCCALLRQAHEQDVIQLDTSHDDSWTILPPPLPLSEYFWDSSNTETLVSQIQLAPQVLAKSAAEIAPHLLIHHLEILSQTCHKWLESINLTQQNCALLLATKQIISDWLEQILTIKAPDLLDPSQV